ncbi:longevity assurance proteins LAG1/LAC1 [Daldinia vernicosa]|uniref:longevity assurance proteins LAG1/LAC1 n=1 Tax=Daldinia vernicosa TaxID=114800 RepID=UPI002007678E|nr:longevity assurance proteins LAG1/LAC1 [Daldinia vernicosa]KAI0845906.1 longevity assurance proteins LAG1/LAC1 [Daldinia vernicosa]
MDSHLSPAQNNTSRQRRKGDTCIGNGTPKLSLGTRNGHASWPTEKHYHKRRKSRSLLRRSWTLPLVLTLATLLLYAPNPTNSNVIHHFLFLSYEVDDVDGSPQYGKGPWDLAFVGFYTILLSFTREFVMYEVLRPLARIFGIKSRGKQLRFMEQMYIVFYIAFMGPFGMYCMKQTPVWYFNTRGMYEGFPHKTHNANIKFYYLFQAAFWVQQSLVMLLGFEQRRKDFQELVGHHIVTIALIGLSYRFHFTYMGIAVYTTHDISDFFLALSKSLNYINSPYQGHSFGLCIIIWTYLRHYINLRIIYSLFNEYGTIGPYELDWETEQYKSPLSNIVTFVLLASLQALNLFWLYCLLRNAYRFVFLGIAKDDRSEDEAPETDNEARGKAPSLDGNLIKGTSY